MAARRRGVAAARGRARRTAALGAVAGTAALLGTWWIFTGPAVGIREVVVQGYERPDVVELDAYVQRAVSRGSMLDLPVEEVRSELERFPWVADVLIRRDWPSTVHVDIVQTRPAIVVRTPNGPLGLSSRDGRLLGGATKAEAARLPRLRVPTLPTRIGAPLTRREERAVAAFVGELPDLPGFGIRTVEVTTHGGIVAQMKSGLELRLGTAELMKEKALAVQAVLPRLEGDDRSKGAYLDVRVPRNPATGRSEVGGESAAPAPAPIGGLGSPAVPAPDADVPTAPPATTDQSPPAEVPSAASPEPATATPVPEPSPATTGQPSTTTPASAPPEPPGGSNSEVGVDSSSTTR